MKTTKLPKNDLKYFISLFIIVLMLTLFSLRDQFEWVFTNTTETLTVQPHPELLQAKMRFEQNSGQFYPGFDFVCRGNQHIHFISSSKLFIKTSHRKTGTVSIEMQGSDKKSTGAGKNLLGSTSNYLMGNDPSSWISDVAHFGEISYENLYPGIDLLYRIEDNKLEFDFIVHPNANPDQISMLISASKDFQIAENGNLLIDNTEGTLILEKPLAWQWKNGEKKRVAVQFEKNAGQTLNFKLGNFSPDETLIIDPKIAWMSYLGGTKTDIANAIAVDDEGCAYVAGKTLSSDFPAFSSYQPELYEGTFTYLSDAFVTKFNADGTDIVYSTYLGGNWDDEANAIAVDAKGNAYITGRTSSKDDEDTPEFEGFPVHNALIPKSDQNHSNTSNGFISVLNSSGTGLIYSSYLGGKYEDYGMDIAVDNAGYAYITGSTFSFDFPVKNAFIADKPSYHFDAFVTRIDPRQSGDASLVYSTYLGGGLDDYGYSVAVDNEGCAYVTGQAKSTDFPTSANAMQASKNGDTDLFLTKLSADGSSAVYSTYLGGEGNDAWSEWNCSIEVDAEGNAYFSTHGSTGFPEVPGSFSSPSAFYVCKVKSDGSALVYSAKVPVYGTIALDDTGQVYIGGSIGEQDEQGVWHFDSRIGVLNPEGSDTLFTYRFGGTGRDGINGIAVDKDRNIYVTGTTDSPDLPAEKGYQKTLSGSTDSYVTKIGETEEKLVVKVMQDPLGHVSTIIPNTWFEIFHIDLDKPASEILSFVENQQTDNKGFLYLSKDYFAPGSPVFIRARPERVPADKKYREDLAANMYEVHVDNLILDKKGNISPQILESDPLDTTLSYMSHTSIGFSLVVSIEWLASQAYIDNLGEAMRMAGNLLYDVTNGHAFIDYVEIYDNKEFWNHSDIQIYANNLQWPEATPSGIHTSIHWNNHGHIALPPNFWGDTISTIEIIYEEDPIDPATYEFAATIVHEFGHYALGFYDEYQDKDGTPIYREVTFGFMDEIDNQNNKWATEMSVSTSEAYKKTEQYSYWDMNCWDLFEWLYSDWYGSLRAKIHKPSELGLSQVEVMEGPNSKPDEPDFPVGQMMTVVNKATTTTNPRKDYQVVKSESGEAASYAKIRLVKGESGRFIEHGRATFLGYVKFFNAEAGDKIYATVSNSGPYNYSYLETVVGESQPGQKSTAEVLELKTVSGDFAFLSEIGFSSRGKPTYNCVSGPIFETNPTFQVYQKDKKPRTTTTLFHFDGEYSAHISDTAFTQGTVLFSAPDSTGENFFVLQNASVFYTDSIRTPYWSSLMGFNLLLDTLQTRAKKFSILASDFPPPMNGLPDSVFQLSHVFGINSYPQNSAVNGQFELYYFSDSMVAVNPNAVSFYKWESDRWIGVESRVDLEYETLSMSLQGNGHYAAFLDMSKNITGIHDQYKPEPGKAEIQLTTFPNPAANFVNLSYQLSMTSRVEADIFDMHGKKIYSWYTKTLPEGKYTEVWNCIDHSGNPVPDGIYFAVLKVGDKRVSRKLLLVK